jgi:hypothetical protein
MAEAVDISSATVESESSNAPNQLSNCLPSTTGCCTLGEAVLAFFPKRIFLASTQKYSVASKFNVFAFNPELKS